MLSDDFRNIVLVVELASYLSLLFFLSDSNRNCLALLIILKFFAMIMSLRPLCQR